MTALRAKLDADAWARQSSPQRDGKRCHHSTPSVQRYSAAYDSKEVTRSTYETTGLTAAAAGGGDSNAPMEWSSRMPLENEERYGTANHRATTRVMPMTITNKRKESDSKVPVSSGGKLAEEKTENGTMTAREEATLPHCRRSGRRLLLVARGAVRCWKRGRPAASRSGLEWWLRGWLGTK